MSSLFTHVYSAKNVQSSLLSQVNSSNAMLQIFPNSNFLQLVNNVFASYVQPHSQNLGYFDYFVPNQNITHGSSNRNDS